MQVINYFYYKNKNLEIKNSKDNIWSHNQMSTFFSSTDLNTLREEGIDRNHFVSLIVNNEGTYTAAITRKVTSNKVVKNDFSYPSFGDTLIASNEEYLTESEEIEWFYLKIEFETNKDFQNDLKSRLLEIKTNKEAKSKVKYIVKNNTVEQKQLPFNDAIKSFDKTMTEETKEYVPWDIKELDKTYKDLYGSLKIEETTLRDMLLQLLTGSLIIANSSKLDPNKWLPTMSSLFDKRFGVGEGSLKVFEVWADSFVEFLCWHTEDKNLKKNDRGEIASILAYFLYKELVKLPKWNRYIVTYMKNLESYLY